MVKDKNQEVAVVEQKTAPAVKKNKMPTRQKIPANVTMEQVFMEAIRTPDLAPDNLEKLVALKERLEAAEAKKAFNVSMAAFQGKIGVISGTKEVRKSDKTLIFRYAPLDQIVPIIRKPLADRGLSVTYDSKVDDKKIRRTTCTVTHVQGHFQTATFESGEVEKSSLMNNLQAGGATLQYHRRYSLIMALNLVTAGEDDESHLQSENGKATKKITKAQVKILENAIGTADESLYKAVTVEYGVSSLDDIPADKFKNCKERIAAYKNKKKELQQAKKEQPNMELAT